MFMIFRSLIALAFLLGGTYAFALQEKQSAEEDIAIEGPKGPVRGSLIKTGASDAPLVVILPGSGPIDRNGNSLQTGIQAATYRLLAEGLADQKIDTIRYDKRGQFASASAIPDGNDVTIADYASDAIAFTQQGIADTGRECAWLLGHSEGGLIALTAAQSQSVCGLILVAAPGKPIGQVLRDQLTANPANQAVLDQAFAAIEKLEAGQRVDTGDLHPGLATLFGDAIQPFLIDIMTYDPAALIANVDKPILLLYGTKDLQTPVEHGELLKQANANAKLIAKTDMNHVLKTVQGDDLQSNTLAYITPDLPLAEGVVAAVSEFVMQNGSSE